MLNKSFLENLITATVNGSDGNPWINLTTYYRAESGLSTIKRDLYINCEDPKARSEEVQKDLEARGYLRVLFGEIAQYVLTDDKGIPKAVLQLSWGTSLSFRGFGDEEELKWVTDYFESFRTKKEGTRIATADWSPHGLSFQHDFVTDEDLDAARQSFYPWLTVSLEEYFKAYLESDEAVLILFGMPGTGKSTFLRTFFAHCGKCFPDTPNLLAYSPEVVDKIELIKTFHADDTSHVLAYEDIDGQLGKREDGNQLMSSILNATEGVVRRKDKKKIIFSTNLSSTEKIDPALMRVGRCFDILKFELLNQAEAETVVKDMGREPRDFSTKHEWSLAEVLQKDVPAQQSMNRFGRKVGFK